MVEKCKHLDAPATSRNQFSLHIVMLQSSLRETITSPQAVKTFAAGGRARRYANSSCEFINQRLFGTKDANSSPRESFYLAKNLRPNRHKGPSTC